MRLLIGDHLRDIQRLFRDYSSLSISPHDAILYLLPPDNLLSISSAVYSSTMPIISCYLSYPFSFHVYSLVGNGGGGSRTLLYPTRQDCCGYAVFLSSLAGISMPLISISVAMCSFHSAMVVFGLQI